jgi:hypothetical protein
LAAPTDPPAGPDQATPHHPTSPEPCETTVAQILLTYGSPLPTVSLLDGSRNRGVLLGHDARGHIEFGIDGIVLTLDPDVPAALITDPQARAHILTDAFATTRRTYLWLSGELHRERENLAAARQHRQQVLNDIRAFLITSIDAGQLDRRQANAFLVRQEQRPYTPRLHVTYTATGSFDVDASGPDAGDAAYLASRISVDLDSIDVLIDSHDVEIRVTDISRVDDDLPS